MDDACTEHINFDTFWKVHRGRSLIVEGYKDEIASKKGKAVTTLVHKHRWVPYGERIGEDSKQAAYGTTMLAFTKGLMNTCLAKNSELLKVRGADAVMPEGLASITSCLPMFALLLYN